MPENYVEVELIKNPSVKRTMNVNSFKMNQKKWRLQDGESLDAPVVKKKVVEPAVKEVVNFPKQELQTDEGFVKVSDTIETNNSGVIDALRDQYKAKTGKDADKRWNISRLTKEING